MSKFIIITTINSPSLAIGKFSRWKNWQLVVAGDKKTPSAWSHKNTSYLDVKSQIEYFPKLTSYIRENTYTRKMYGYLYAIKHGAKHIFESDDDNIPYRKSEKILNDLIENKMLATSMVSSNTGWVNIYSLFTSKHVWPRGYSLSQIIDRSSKRSIVKNRLNTPIFQFLADGDPDVDAIYRLTSNSSVRFAKGGSYSLKPQVYCPFNSQATLWSKEAFPLLYFPLGVSDRVTDILRGYIALNCLWKMNSTLAYGSALVFQERNEHNLQSDFNLEIPLYSDLDRWLNVLKNISGNSYSELFASAIKLLVEDGSIPEINIEAYSVFLSEISIYEK